MECIIAIEKRNNNLDRFFELLSKQSEVTIKELKMKVSKSSFYKIVLRKIYDINELVKFIEPSFSFCESDLIEDQNGKIFQGFRKNPNLQIIENKSFYILKFSDDGKQKGTSGT